MSVEVTAFSKRRHKLRSSRSDSNRRLQATMGQNSSSFQLASACHVCAAVLVHVARRRRLDSDLDERSFRDLRVHRSVRAPVSLRFHVSFEISRHSRKTATRNAKGDIFFLPSYLSFLLPAYLST